MNGTTFLVSADYYFASKEPFMVKNIGQNGNTAKFRQAQNIGLIC